MSNPAANNASVSIPDLTIKPIHAVGSNDDNAVVFSLGDKGEMYLTEFQDNYDPRYNSVNTFGRMDPIVSYQGTSRKISLALEFTNAASTGAEKHAACKRLLYPTYQAASTVPNALTIERPPLVFVKMGNLIHDPRTKEGYLLCVLESYGMTPGMGFTPVDSPLVRFGASGQKQIAFQQYAFRFEFVPLHPRTPGFSGGSNPEWIGGDVF